MTQTKATGYDLLSSRSVAEVELRAFLRECFGITDRELFVSHVDNVADALRDITSEVVFTAFCTYERVRGHFAMRVDVGIEGRLVDRVGRREFAERFAARFDAYVLYGDTEPSGVWTVVLPDGTGLLAAMEEDDDHLTLYRASAPIPDLPEVAVDSRL